VSDVRSALSVPFFSVSSVLAGREQELAAAIRGLEPLGDVRVARLERAIGDYVGGAECVAVASGSDALALMLRAAGIGPGDEVIVPAYTFFASASSVAHVGATPVLVDVLPGSYALDPARVEAALTPRTAVIMPVHLFAQMAPMDALLELARVNHLAIFEDSAEAIGMRVEGRHAGLWGEAGVLSFFPSKTLGAFGDAGLVMTRSAELAERVRALADGSAEGGAWASACDELAATVLLLRLEQLDDEIAARAEVAARYAQQLADLEQVTLPQLNDEVGVRAPVWYVYLMECDRRDELAARLAGVGVETEVFYPRPLSAQPCFADGGRAVVHPVPVCELASKRALALPLYPGLSTVDVDRVCAAIREFYGRRGG
jgi:UDP-2-acetamido-2-deoxy-ribo-hexuluronate aminotransferase